MTNTTEQIKPMADESKTPSGAIDSPEGECWREASALEVIEDPKRYGDAATNCESAALRRAASKFGLCLYLYDK
jgi:hypothetical protein